MSGFKTSSSRKNKSLVKWGILGTGFVANTAVGPGIQRSENGTIYAIASRSLERAKDYAKKFKVPVTYGSYDELLKDPSVQAVYISLPNTMHREWTVRAAEQGKHVLCEKPLTTGAREAHEMVNACSKNKVLLMEAFQYRLHPQTLGVKKLIDAGKIGKVLSINAVHSSGPPDVGNIRVNAKLGGGALADKGSYCVNVARFFSGTEPTGAFARGDFDKDGLDWRITADLSFPGGGTAWAETTHKLASGSYYQSCEIFGEKGRIYISHPFGQRAITEHGDFAEASFRVLIDGAVKQDEEDVHIQGVDQYQLEVEYFAERVLKGEPIGFPMEDGLAQTRTMDAIYKSAKEGRVVNL
jgi:D-xylose 1-dehydrogenase (NADP+, D-xylono-1,5-lactone-forming)